MAAWGFLPSRGAHLNGVSPGFLSLVMSSNSRPFLATNSASRSAAFMASPMSEGGALEGAPTGWDPCQNRRSMERVVQKSRAIGKET